MRISRHNPSHHAPPNGGRLDGVVQCQNEKGELDERPVDKPIENSIAQTV